MPRERRRSDRHQPRRRSMSPGDGHSLIASDPETRRALELDTLAAILPMDRRDRLAELLTDDDVATLTHLAREGIGANTSRALASDLAYLETWAWAVLSGSLPWPAPEALILRFIAQHLWDRAGDRSLARHARGRCQHPSRKRSAARPGTPCALAGAPPAGPLVRPAPLARSHRPVWST